jgi:long-subunit acyl-CoA synthetase (AMP-forming)
VVGGRLFQGYLGTPGTLNGTENGTDWPTGDLGHIDADGYLFLTGRKKTAYATAFGRNVSPEWVESALTGHPYIAQAAVFGEAAPFNAAVLVPRPGIAPYELSRAVATVNDTLPDYARIGGWVLADHPFMPANGLSNGAGCIRRGAIQSLYQTRIEQLYATEEIHAVP